MVHTIKTHGPDRIAGFSPIPAMSMISYAAGARLLQLIGGVSLSFYDWYCDLPPASPETWGEQTDVHEIGRLVSRQAAGGDGREPEHDAHARLPFRGRGAAQRHEDVGLLARLQPGRQVRRRMGRRQRRPGRRLVDGRQSRAADGVPSREADVRTSSTTRKKFTDAPYLVELHEDETASTDPGSCCAPAGSKDYADERTRRVEVPDVGRKPTAGPRCRWAAPAFAGARTQGQVEPAAEGRRGRQRHRSGAHVPRTSTTASCRSSSTTSARARLRCRGVPVEAHRDGRWQDGARRDRLRPADGAVRRRPRARRATIPRTTTTRTRPTRRPGRRSTRAWTARSLIRFAREWATTAERPNGKCTIIIGAGINHWYHANLMYRAGIHALMFCGCVGVNGGGLAHYVGQEKLAPAESWVVDRLRPRTGTRRRGCRTRRAGTTSTPTSGATRRTSPTTTRFRSARPKTSLAQGHTMDMQVRAVRSGWLPFYPQFHKNPLDVVQRSRGGGRRFPTKTSSRYVVDELKSGETEVLGRRSRRARKLAASLVHLARQRADGEREGARVFPEALPRHAHERDRRGPGQGLGQGSHLARQGADREDGPGRRSELPHGHVGALLRHRPAGGDLVREGRSQLDRHAQLHSSAVGGRAAVLGVEERLADLHRRSRRSSPSSRRSTSRSRSRTSSRRRSRTTRRPRSHSRT